MVETACLVVTIFGFLCRQLENLFVIAFLPLCYGWADFGSYIRKVSLDLCLQLHSKCPVNSPAILTNMVVVCYIFLIS